MRAARPLAIFAATLLLTAVPVDAQNVAGEAVAEAATLARGCAAGSRRPGTGALVGFVRDAGTGIRVTLARVTAAWPNGDGTSGHAKSAADSTGAYRLCAVPIGTPITLTARFGPRSRSAIVRIPRAEAVRHDIELFLEDEGRLIGRVVDAETSTPIPDAVVTIPGTDLRQVTDTVGRFYFETVPAGEHPVRAEHPGYRYTVASVAVPGRTTVEIEIRLGAEPVLLDAITVITSRRTVSPAMEGFDRRRRRGFGHFITRDELDKASSRTVFQLLESVPGLRVVPAGPRRYRLETGRSPGCSPTIYIDGFPFPMGKEGLDYISYAPASEIEGIEVYRGLSEVPAEFAAHEPRCGAVIIWTRRGR